MIISQNDILTEERAAELLGVKPRTIRLWRKTRGLPFIKLTQKEIRLRRADVDEWLASRIVRTGVL